MVMVDLGGFLSHRAPVIIQSINLFSDFRDSSKNPTILGYPHDELVGLEWKIPSRNG